MEYKAHPAAAIYPLAADDEFEALKADIKARGLLSPIELFDGQIIDGRNRLKACKRLRIEPKFTAVETDDPIGYVRARNVNRRMLSKGQIAIIAVRAEYRDGGGFPSHGGDRTIEASGSDCPLTNRQVAERYGISETYVKWATGLVQRSDKEQAKAVLDGTPLEKAHNLLISREKEKKRAARRALDTQLQAAAKKAATKEQLDEPEPVGVQVFADEPSTAAEPKGRSVEVALIYSADEFKAFQEAVEYLTNEYGMPSQQEAVLKALKNEVSRLKDRRRRERAKLGTQLPIPETVSIGLMGSAQ